MEDIKKKIRLEVLYSSLTQSCGEQDIVHAGAYLRNRKPAKGLSSVV